jgi:glycosyltransferase involved in cell wall biosynthesis
LIKDGRRGALADFRAESFADACARLGDDPEATYKLGGGVAAYIASATSWSGKIDRLLDLADAAPAEPKLRKMVFAVLEQPLGEIM